VHEQEFVVGGFTPPSKGGHGIGALLLGYYENGSLRYAGRAGTGFTQKSQSIVRKQIDKLIQKSAPFAEVPADARRDARWVEPVLVAQIAFATWTRDDLLRQAVFKGLREDKAAREVHREDAGGSTEETPTKLKKTQKTTTPSDPEKRTAGVDQRQPGRNRFGLTHPEKIIDAESGLTKQALAEYYFDVSKYMLPYISGRPLSIVRCPEGSGKPCFFQKHVGKGMPPGVDSVPVTDPKTGAKEPYITLSTAEGLVGLTQMGVMEIHPWGSRNDSLETPDLLIFDLDPDTAIDWKTLGATARKFKSFLKGLGLESFVKTTGGKGLHVVVPIRAEHTWAVIKSFAHAVVLRIAESDPDLYVTTMSKAARKGKIYLDYLRNDRGATAVAPYSSRARAGVGVAVPLNWRELSGAAKPEFHVADFDTWKQRLRHDPWKKMLSMRQPLTKRAISAVEPQPGKTVKS
jgi:bifunctional non-homologous end joining protein LigD